VCQAAKVGGSHKNRGDQRELAAINSIESPVPPSGALDYAWCAQTTSTSRGPA
jgi:hypothetical protein